jgi:hypothetical protein
MLSPFDVCNKRYIMIGYMEGEEKSHQCENDPLPHMELV